MLSNKNITIIKVGNEIATATNLLLVASFSTLIAYQPRITGDGNRPPDMTN